MGKNRQEPVQYPKTAGAALEDDVSGEAEQPFVRGDRDGGPSRPVRFTPGNAFVSANKNTISVDEQLNATIDYEQLAVSKGVLRAPEVAAVTSDAEAHTLLFSYEEEEFGRQAVATDVMYAFVLEKQKMCSKVFRLDTRAESSQPQVDVPAKWEMASLATYLSLLSADGRKASGSLFLPIG